MSDLALIADRQLISCWSGQLAGSDCSASMPNTLTGSHIAPLSQSTGGQSMGDQALIAEEQPVSCWGGQLSGSDWRCDRPFVNGPHFKHKVSSERG